MVILADVGGTNTRVAISSDGATILNEEIFDTPNNPKDGLFKIREAMQKLSKGEQIEMAVFGIAGVCSPDRSTIVRSPHLPKWVENFTTNFATQYLGVPVHLENDAALGGLGEAVFGAGKEFGIVAYITIGTGIGGVRIVNKIIDNTYYGFEIGHQIIQFEHDTAIWEDVLSGSALEKRYGTPSKNIKDEDIWNEIAIIFADGLYNTILHWSPQCVVLGGSVMKDIPLQVISEQLIKRMNIFPELPRMMRGELGDSCGIYGGIALSNTLRK